MTSSRAFSAADALVGIEFDNGFCGWPDSQGVSSLLAAKEITAVRATVADPGWIDCVHQPFPVSRYDHLFGLFFGQCLGNAPVRKAVRPSPIREAGGPAVSAITGQGPAVTGI